MADLPDTSFNLDVIAEFGANGGKVGRSMSADNATLLLSAHHRRERRLRRASTRWGTSTSTVR